MKKTFLPLLLLFIVCALISSCAAANSKEQSVEFYAMNTVMTMKAYGSAAPQGLAAAEAEINRLDALWSVGRDESEVSRLNAGGKDPLSGDTLFILKEALDISRMTGGAFDCTVYPLMKLWGFYSGDYHVPTGAELAALLPLVGSDHLSLDDGRLELPDGMGVDLGGIAKGCASDRAVQLLAQSGVDSAICSLGGNVQVLGARPDGAPWRVAIRNPADENVPLGIVSVTDKAVITSGGYERYFEKDGRRYHHILDPKTGKPAENGLSSVTIVCGRGVVADGLSTALFVLGLDKAQQFYRGHRDLFDAVLVTDEGDILITDGLDGEFASEFAFEVIR